MASTVARPTTPGVTGSGELPSTMRAAVYADYGGPERLELTEVDRPSPADDEVLVRVVAAAVNAGDWHLLCGSPFLIRLLYGGIRRPAHPILGVDIAGRVAEIGDEVDGFAVGDAVIADLSSSGFGGFAEYVCVPEAMVVEKPDAVSFEAAAAITTAGVAALQALRDAGRLQAGESVLVNGASGGVGTFAVQVATALGAGVTGVCSTGKVDVVRSLGADAVVDYTEEDFTASGTQYDLIVDAAGSHSLLAVRGTLNPGGRYVMVGGPFRRFLGAMVGGPLLSAIGNRTFGAFTVQPNPEDLASVSERVVAGDIDPVIDRTFELSEVAEAIRYVEEGRATGKVVIGIE